MSLPLQTRLFFLEAPKARISVAWSTRRRFRGGKKFGDSDNWRAEAIYLYRDRNIPLGLECVWISLIFLMVNPPRSYKIVGDGRFSTNKFLYYCNIQNRPWISHGWWFSKVDSYNPRKRWVHGYGWWTPALQGPKKNRKNIIYPKLQCLGFQGLVVRGVFNNNLLLSWKWTSISGSSCWWFVFVCLREFFGEKRQQCIQDFSWCDYTSLK